MKHIVVSILAFTSVSAMACPDLSGHFLCKAFTNGKDQDVQMIQNMDRGIPVYQMTILVAGETPSVRSYNADGVVRPLTREGYTNYTNRAFCDGDSLKVEVKGTGSDANHPSQDGVVTVKLDAQGNMYDSYAGKWGSEPNKFFDETCQRVQ